MKYPTIGDRLRAARTQRGMSQTKFSIKSGLSRATVANFESNRRIPNLHTFIAMSDLNYMFGRASKEGHEVGQKLAEQVREKMQRARAIIAAPRQPGEMGAGVQTRPLDEADLARMHVRPASAQQDKEPRCDVCGAKTTDPWLDHRGCQQLASAQQDEREAFETWAHDKGFTLDCAFFAPGNNYDDEDTRLAFEIWMASRSAFVRTTPIIQAGQLSKAETLRIGKESGLVTWVSQCGDYFQFAEEVGECSSERLVRFASLIRAAQQVQADAGAVAWQAKDINGAWADIDREDYVRLNGDHNPFFRKLYTRPAAESDKRDGTWHTQAVAWLKSKAAEQAQINEKYPDHVACYPSWTQKVRTIEQLASELERDAAMSREQSGGNEK